MAETVDTIEDSKTEVYFVEYKYSTENSGIITTDLNEEDTRERLTKEFDKEYGEGNWEVITLRVATDADIDQCNAWFETALAALEMPDESELN